MATESLGWPLSQLDQDKLRTAAEALARVDMRLGRLLDGSGPPPLWARPEGFSTLVKIILEQQVSLDSAAAAFRTLEQQLGDLTPRSFLTLDDAQLKRIGFSRQKAGYCRGLARGLRDGSIDLAGLGDCDDDDARHLLTSIRGVGPWTADVYLLFALRRPDVWPVGDRALVVSMAEQFDLAEIPTYDEAAAVAERWRPWRSVAARMLWQAYLLKRGRSLD